MGGCGRRLVSIIVTRINVGRIRLTMDKREEDLFDEEWDLELILNSFRGA